MSVPTIFLSYSHADADWRDRLVRHLRIPFKQELLEFWDDRKIGAGDDWRREIQQALARADAAILLVSASSMGSDFILDIEVPQLISRNAARKACFLFLSWSNRVTGKPSTGSSG